MMLRILGFFIAIAFLAGTVKAQNKTELLWLGQAGFRIKTPGGKVIVIDPWLRNGPKAPAQYKDPANLGKVDFVLVTHAHVDHIGDAPEIAKANKVILYGPADMITPLVTLGVMPAELTHRFNKSGFVTPHGIKVTAVKAEHGGNNVALSVAGGSSAIAEVLRDHQSIERVDDSNRYFEIALQKGADPQALLRRLVEAGAVVQRFELVQPSLHQIFLEKVGAKGVEEGMSGHG